MTPSEINALIDRRLAGWLDGDAYSPLLRDRIACAIYEAIDARDKLWSDGNATLRHELRAMTQARDDAVAAAHLMHEGK